LCREYSLSARKKQGKSENQTVKLKVKRWPDEIWSKISWAKKAARWNMLRIPQAEDFTAKGIPQAKRLHGPRQISWAKKADILKN
jgi:hypothetical protein